MEIERQLLELYKDQGLAEKPALLNDRGGAYYSEAAAQLIASLHDGAGDIQVVDVRNDGALPDLPDSAVVEVPCRVDRDGAHPLPLAPLAPEMRGLVQAAKAYEELAVEAAMSGDRRTALRALIANPLVGAEVAEPLLDALIEANRAYLPRFVRGLTRGDRDSGAGEALHDGRELVDVADHERRDPEAFAEHLEARDQPIDRVHEQVRRFEDVVHGEVHVASGREGRPPPWPPRRAGRR